MNMKKLLVILLLASGCSTTRIYNMKSIVDLKSDDLKTISANDLQASHASEYKQSPTDKSNYYESLMTVVPYRNYLYVECLRLLQRDNGLALDKPIYVSKTSWNEIIRMYSAIFNFQAVVDNITTEKTMQCSLEVNDKREVRKYELKDFDLSMEKKEAMPDVTVD
jgi:hypothetical protein